MKQFLLAITMLLTLTTLVYGAEKARVRHELGICVACNSIRNLENLSTAVELKDKDSIEQLLRMYFCTVIGEDVKEVIVLQKYYDWQRTSFPVSKILFRGIDWCMPTMALEFYKDKP